MDRKKIEINFKQIISMLSYAIIDLMKMVKGVELN